MTRFDNPQVLYCLLFLIPLALAALIRYRKLRGLLKLFPPNRRGISGELRFRYGLSTCCFLLFLGCLIIALAGPYWGSRLIPESRRGMELVLAMDISRSMNTRDMIGASGQSLSRLEQGVALARDLVAVSPDVRFGVALGKGSAVLALPLTDDTEAVLTLLEGLSSSLLTGRGTNLEALITAAAGAFQDPFPSRRRILLFSDGEALSGALSQGIERAIHTGITISAVGLGTLTGGAVPVEDGEAGVVSYLQAGALRNAAERSGGLYFDGNGERVLARLVEHISVPSTDSPALDLRREPKAQWHIFVVIALAALGIAAAAGKEWRKDRQVKRLKARNGVLLCLAALFLGSCSRLSGQLLIMEGSFFSARNRPTEAITAYLKALAIDEAAPYAEYGLGCVYLSLDEGQAALERFAAAAEALSRFKPEGDTELVYRIRYNAGVIHFQNSDFGAAAEEFRRALEADNNKIEAKRNLELSLLSQRAGEQAAAASPLSGNTGGESHEALFEYLRRKERDKWKSQEWAADAEAPGPDY